MRITGASTGIGRQLKNALDLRREWLAAQDLAMPMSTGEVKPMPGMIRTLADRELSRLERRITDETGFRAYREANLANVRGGRLLRTINQPSMQLAVIDRQGEIAIVPWGATRDLMRGRSIGGRDLAIALTRGRDLGLSR